MKIWEAPRSQRSALRC